MARHITKIAARALLTSLLTLFAVMATGCDNNGNIGRWYGAWRLQSVTVDGREYTGWQIEGACTSFAFQNNIVNIQRTDQYDDILDVAWGTWSEEGDRLTMDFSHSNGVNGSYLYKAPEWIGFDPGVTVLTVSGSDDALTLTATHTNGTRWTYTLSKAY